MQLLLDTESSCSIGSYAWILKVPASAFPRRSNLITKTDLRMDFISQSVWQTWLCRLIQASPDTSCGDSKLYVFCDQIRFPIEERASIYF